MSFGSMDHTLLHSVCNLKNCQKLYFSSIKINGYTIYDLKSLTMCFTSIKKHWKSCRITIGKN